MKRFLLPKKKQREYNGGAWSLGRWNSFVTSILRSGSRRWPPKYECLAEAKTEKKINVKTGRLAQHYRCAMCGGEFVATEVQVDHKIPMGSDRTWDDFINELYCEKDNLQVLCKTDHATKTKSERKTKLKSTK